MATPMTKDEIRYRRLEGAALWIESLGGFRAKLAKANFDHIRSVWKAVYS